MSQEILFLVCGEGPSDVGCEDRNPGVLMKALETLGERALSPHDTLHFRLFSRLDLARPSFLSPRRMVMRGGKNAAGENKAFAALQQQARILGEMAKREARENQWETGAILFHDCDFTQKERLTAEKAYQMTLSAVERGFASTEDFQNGVAMIPCTRSECWLLSHYQEKPYHNSQRFEKASPGNDASPHSPKKLLAKFLACRSQEIYQRVDGDEIQWEKIDSPSFLFFRKRYHHVLQRMLHLPIDCPEKETLITQE